MDLTTSANRAPAMPVTPMLINSALLTGTANGAAEWNEGMTLFAVIPSAAHRARAYTAAAGQTSSIHNFIKKNAGVGHPPRGNPL